MQFLFLEVTDFLFSDVKLMFVNTLEVFEQNMYSVFELQSLKTCSYWGSLLGLLSKYSILPHNFDGLDLSHITDVD